MSKYTSEYTGAEIDERLDAVSNKVDEAPSDGNYYLRKDGEWVETSSGGDGSVDVVQSTGTSTVAVMSQAAATDAIESIITKVTVNFTVGFVGLIKNPYYFDGNNICVYAPNYDGGLGNSLALALRDSNGTTLQYTSIPHKGDGIFYKNLNDYGDVSEIAYIYIYVNAGNITENCQYTFYITSSNIATNTANIATNTANIATNTANIATNAALMVKSSDIAQSTGDSTTSVMSQKAATESFLTTYSEELEDVLAYGIQFDTTVSSPTCTRLGSMTLHKTLPIQSGMRGCRLTDDGEIYNNTYLPDRNWKAYNLAVYPVMVEIPAHYRKFVTDGTVRQVWISEYPIEGYTKVPMMYVSAYEATVNRTTNTLNSVVNTTTDYRGGNNNADYDDTYRTFLGRPATNISLTNFRTYARNRKEGSTEWNCMTYEAHKTIFWLFVTEYATLNSQEAVNAELTTEGYKQGGLGDGPTTLSSGDWDNFNGYYPFIPCGYTNSLGNGTGQVLYEVYDEANDVTISTYANRYRGIENPFGHLWQWADGILVDVRTDDYGGEWQGMNRVFVAEDPANFASPSTLADNYDGYEFRGLQARTSISYIKEVIFGNYGDIIAEVVGGSSSTYFCDYNYTSTSSSSMRGVRFGGSSGSGSTAGLAYSLSVDAPSAANSYLGSRLCFHPNE